MGNPFANMSPDEWPEGVSAADVADVADDVQYMRDHEDDPDPIPPSNK